MNIQPVKSECATAPAKCKATAPKPAAASSAEDAPRTVKLKNLREALRNEPAVRPEELARGRALAADSGYPSQDALAKLAELLVNDASRSK